MLLSPITVNEAVLSSSCIEGTQATLDQVLESDAGLQGFERRQVISKRCRTTGSRCRIAELALQDLAALAVADQGGAPAPHAGVRAAIRLPTGFREDQNRTAALGHHRTRPFRPAQLLLLLLYSPWQAWEAFIQSDAEDPVIQAAIASRAQFEILHPFKDGNYCIGRMLIPLLLYQRRALSAPMFYLSEYLEAHRDEYYDRLFGDHRRRRLARLMEFFINAVAIQAEVNFDKAQVDPGFLPGHADGFPPR